MYFGAVVSVIEILHGLVLELLSTAFWTSPSSYGCQSSAVFAKVLWIFWNLLRCKTSDVSCLALCNNSPIIYHAENVYWMRIALFLTGKYISQACTKRHEHTNRNVQVDWETNIFGTDWCEAIDQWAERKSPDLSSAHPTVSSFRTVLISVTLQKPVHWLALGCHQSMDLFVSWYHWPVCFTGFQLTDHSHTWLVLHLQHVLKTLDRMLLNR